MRELRFVRLERRAIIAIGGDDRRTYLQGLISNDVTRLSFDRALFAAMLTPQGKFLFDLFLAQAADGTFLIDTEADRADALIRKLTMHRLRAKVTIEPDPTVSIYAAWGDGAAARLGVAAPAGSTAPFAGGIALVDPRLAAAGVRLLLPEGGETALAAAGFTPGDLGEWDRARIGLGLPDGARDMEPEKALLLENGYEELAGVDFEKGCYMGQELTARTRYRGLIRKRLMPVVISGPAPAAGTIIHHGEVEAGEMRSSVGDLGLALIRLEAFKASGGQGLTCGDAVLTATRPDWAKFPETE
ncbi:CAF17-like 4Fe-4S cluster assembly/insertion protein YgfZ [Magnetospirillum molischianum]|uniref:Putative Aminomethyltransferase n=1 Tax=Magnetospirillum molischianum DSM 120 TaxID=1150626 RepID=H8FQ63_MAGML|nr:folate-binding protein YgfZ [Magnetospirillum molischianum]CCG40501.1 putative Aminomethyltransferase [Magnetospirillum molischianum DSM 120]